MRDELRSIKTESFGDDTDIGFLSSTCQPLHMNQSRPCANKLEAARFVLKAFT